MKNSVNKVIFMIEKQNICGKCILPEGFLGIQLNSDGLCNFCADPNYTNVNYSRTIIGAKQKKRAQQDWKKVVRDMQTKPGKTNYDCILGYSGGKDSTALLDYLINKLELRPLAITIDTGFMTDIAKENMKNTLDQIQVDHVLIEDCIDTFTKLYKWHFFNHTSNDTFLARHICDYCSDLIHTIVVKEAIKRDIHYVLFGYSPDQVFRYFYEMPQTEVIEDWMPDLIFNDPIFDENDHRWYLTQEEIRSGKLPRVLLPYHVIPYREQDIIELVESKNYIKKGHADPLLTNCNVIYAAMFYDLNRYGGILYACQYAELVRQEPEIRKKWLRTLKRSGTLILDNKFKPAEVNAFFKQIGITQDEMLDHIQEQLMQDPNREAIKHNIDIFRRKRKKNRTDLPI
jgi:hypothetical protein